MPRWLQPSGRSEYYLLNSNCQHFVLDFGLGIEIDFDAAALSRVWINSRVPQLVAGPTLGILAIYFSHLASKIGLQEHILECSMLHHRSLYAVVLHLLVVQDHQESPPPRSKVPSNATVSNALR